jgi:hypothetical protein
VSGFPGDRKCDSTFQFGNSNFVGLSRRHRLYSTALGTVSKRFLAEFLPAMEKKNGSFTQNALSVEKFISQLRGENRFGDE